MNTTTMTLSIDDGDPAALTVRDQGAGRPVLLLHGGAGPDSVAGFAERLAADGVRVLTPTHPGFAATPRPDHLDSVAGLYGQLLDALALDDVVVIGNSIGGWIGAELALRSRRVGRLVLVNAVGIEVAGHPVADVFSLGPDEVTARAYHDPARFRIDPARLGDAQRAVMAGNRRALAVYAGAPPASSMVDPTLAARLSAVAVPALVVWGEADRIVDVDYGRAFAAAVPGARFELLPAAGHVPQIEAPERLLAAVRAFV
jgi:pimeloyl-ACP methyl ester carboxylesterase